MGLFDLLKSKKNIEILSKFDDDLTHLTSEGELPWGWHSQNKDFIEKTNNEYSFFLNNWLNSRNDEPKKQYAALKSFIVYLEDIEKLCTKKGECFEFWFYEILTTPDYIQKRKEELKELQHKYSI